MLNRERKQNVSLRTSIVGSPPYLPSHQVSCQPMHDNRLRGPHSHCSAFCEIICILLCAVFSSVSTLDLNPSCSPAPMSVCMPRHNTGEATHRQLVVRAVVEHGFSTLFYPFCRPHHGIQDRQLHIFHDIVSQVESASYSDKDAPPASLRSGVKDVYAPESRRPCPRAQRSRTSCSCR